MDEISHSLGYFGFLFVRDFIAVYFGNEEQSHDFLGMS